MPVVHFDVKHLFRAAALGCWCAFIMGSAIHAQMGGMGGNSMMGNRLSGPQQVSARDYYQENGPVISLADAPPVTEVHIVGSETYTDSQVRKRIKTRPGRPYDTELIQADVRRLMSSGMFHNIRPFVDRSERGISVTFEVFERPTIRDIKYLGNEKIKDRVLKKESGLQVGESLNLYTVDEARRKLEQFYQEKGFPKANIQIAEGNKPEDRRVVFIINEGHLQRVFKTEFVGNQFVADRRLKTKIETKRGYLWYIKGRFDRDKLDADVEKLTAYYRSFGFFRAHIGREYEVGPSGTWVSVKFVIDEGPRYVVQSVAFQGVDKFEHQALVNRLETKVGEHFHIGKLNKDIAKLRDFYGHYGYIFADIQADPRFLEEPGGLDVIFDVEEGELVRIRNINVNIAGENPHTSKKTVWARLDMRPGDILRSQTVRDAERRLKAAQIFKVDPASGSAPRIVVKPVEDEQEDYDIRGQSPHGFTKTWRRRPWIVRGQHTPPGVNFVPALQSHAMTGQSPTFRSPTPVPPTATGTPTNISSQAVGPAQHSTYPHSNSYAPPNTWAQQPNHQQPRSYVLPNTQAPMNVAPRNAPYNNRISHESAQPPPIGYSQGNLPAQSNTFNKWIPGSTEHQRRALPVSGQPLQSARNPLVQSSAAPPQQQTLSALNSNYQSFPSAPSGRSLNNFRNQPTAVPSAPGSRVAANSNGLPFAPHSGPSDHPPNVPPGASVQGPVVPGSAAVGPPPVQAHPGGPYLQSLGPGNRNASMLPPPPNPLTLPGLGPTPGMLADVDVMLEETQTGRFMFGVGVNSDAGVIGNIVIDERNFDLFRVPRSWQDVGNGQAFRGGGQGFRLEALPGTRVQRYTISLTEPYLFGTQISSNISGYFFNRRFFDWDEQRFGGRLGFGYRLGPDLSTAMNVRAEQVEITNPRTVGTAPQLDAVIGEHDVFSGRVSLTHDTRDIAFAPTEGHLFEMSYEQVFGSFNYPRGNVDYRQYFLVHQRPDFSGRHTVGFSFRLGVSGDDTPIFENYFAGGFSTMRGFDFRGASPVVGGVIVGGRFQFLGSVEYLFPITADDMLRGVAFVDYGTVEEDIEINGDNYRVAPGFGLRIFVPAMGPAPIALDFAFPIASAPFDDRQIFSFFIGMNR